MPLSSDSFPVLFPFVEARATDSQHLAKELNAVIMLLAFDEGVLYGRDFAKYAAAFFSISISSLRRLFSL